MAAMATAKSGLVNLTLDAMVGKRTATLDKIDYLEFKFNNNIIFIDNRSRGRCRTRLAGILIEHERSSDFCLQDQRAIIGPSLAISVIFWPR
jgi:hypothetical protein